MSQKLAVAGSSQSHQMMGQRTAVDASSPQTQVSSSVSVPSSSAPSQAQPHEEGQGRWYQNITSWAVSSTSSLLGSIGVGSSGVASSGPRREAKSLGAGLRGGLVRVSSQSSRDAKSTRNVRRSASAGVPGISSSDSTARKRLLALQQAERLLSSTDNGEGLASDDEDDDELSMRTDGYEDDSTVLSSSRFGSEGLSYPHSSDQSAPWWARQIIGNMEKKKRFKEGRARRLKVVLNMEQKERERRVAEMRADVEADKLERMRRRALAVHTLDQEYHTATQRWQQHQNQDWAAQAAVRQQAKRQLLAEEARRTELRLDIRKIKMGKMKDSQLLYRQFLEDEKTKARLRSLFDSGIRIACVAARMSVQEEGSRVPYGNTSTAMQPSSIDGLLDGAGFHLARRSLGIEQSNVTDLSDLAENRMSTQGNLSTSRLSKGRSVVKGNFVWGPVKLTRRTGPTVIEQCILSIAAFTGSASRSHLMYGDRASSTHLPETLQGDQVSQVRNPFVLPVPASVRQALAVEPHIEDYLLTGKLRGDVYDRKQSTASSDFASTDDRSPVPRVTSVATDTSGSSFGFTLSGPISRRASQVESTNGDPNVHVHTNDEADVPQVEYEMAVSSNVSPTAAGQKSPVYVGEQVVEQLVVPSKSFALFRYVPGVGQLESADSSVQDGASQASTGSGNCHEDQSKDLSAKAASAKPLPVTQGNNSQPSWDKNRISSLLSRVDDVLQAPSSSSASSVVQSSASSVSSESSYRPELRGASVDLKAQQEKIEKLREAAMKTKSDLDHASPGDVAIRQHTVPLDYLEPSVHFRQPAHAHSSVASNHAPAQARMPTMVHSPGQSISPMAPRPQMELPAGAAPAATAEAVGDTVGPDRVRSVNAWFASRGTGQSQ